MKGKKSFLLYCDQIGLFDQLPDEQAGKLIKLIFSYVNDKNPKVEDLLLKIAFEPIKLQLKRDLEGWNSTREHRSIAGKKGGEASGKARKKKANEASASKSKQTEANEAVTVTVTDKVTVNVTNKPLSIRVDEFTNKIRAFQTILDSIETQKFIDYWTEHGEKDRKARWEKEKAFDIKKRMERWKRNNKSSQQHGQSTTESHRQAIEDIDGSVLSQGDN